MYWIWALPLGELWGMPCAMAKPCGINRGVLGINNLYYTPSRGILEYNLIQKKLALMHLYKGGFCAVETLIFEKFFLIFMFFIKINCIIKMVVS